MICDCCKKELSYEDDIVCENGYLYHKECEFNPYGRRKNVECSDKVYIIWAVKKGENLNGVVILNPPWIYGVFRDVEKALFIQEYMQNSKEYGHLYWGNNFTMMK